MWGQVPSAGPERRRGAGAPPGGAAAPPGGRAAAGRETTSGGFFTLVFKALGDRPSDPRAAQSHAYKTSPRGKTVDLIKPISPTLNENITVSRFKGV